MSEEAFSAAVESPRTGIDKTGERGRENCVSKPSGRQDLVQGPDRVHQLQLRTFLNVEAESAITQIHEHIDEFS